MPDNTLYFGDNLDILVRYVPSESVDLVYLDPPFNSNQDYNVLFAEQDGSRAAAQIKAFGDTWRWDQSAASAFHEMVQGGPERVSQAMQAFRLMLGENDMLAYLSMMAPRLVELHRVLKPTGSLYLHCDPTASHYLKVLLDAVFEPTNFRNEITWKRTFAHGNAGRNYGAVADAILWYSKTDSYQWHHVFLPLSQEYVQKFYRFIDKDGRRHRSVTLRNPGVRPNLHYPYTALNGVTYQPHPNGWTWTPERMRKADEDGRLIYPKTATGALMYKQYLDSSPGVRLSNIWADIPPIGAKASERLGYPTQKPVALLERIINASSNEGDVVLDPFAGCGTAVTAAHKLNRRWIGIDVTHLAITLIKHRLHDTFGDSATYKVVGEPVSLPDAEALFRQDAYQFQWWALGPVGARPVEQKRGADKGVDGRIYFDDEASKTKQLVLQVKGGTLNSSQVRDLRGVMEREGAAIGALISLQEPTKAMRKEAASAGMYDSPFWARSYPRLQLVTVGELLAGNRLDYPEGASVTFRRAARAREHAAQGKLL